MNPKCYAVVPLFLSFTLLASAFPLADSFEDGDSAWMLSGSWGLTAEQSHSPTHSLADSPGLFYSNNSDSTASMAVDVDLSAATAPAASFFHWRMLETGYDYGFVEISTNSGAGYLPTPLMSFTGQDPAWKREQINLDAFIGQPHVRLRFRLVTDSSVVMDGWYIDDAAIGERPDTVTLAAVPSANKVDLSWTASVAGDFAAYRVYRSLSGNVNWQTASLLTEITSQAVTNFTDITAAPKTRYCYRVMVIDTENLHAMSNEVDPVTPAGSDFPFLDDGEGGAARWNPEAVWALSDENAFSGTHSWSDSPGTNYADSYNSSLKLAAPLDLSSAVSPAICFVHNADFLSGDTGNVEVSTNGLDWTSLISLTGQTDGWQRKRFSLASFAGKPALYLRFRVSTSPSGQADGWHLDDIAVAELPGTIDAPMVSEVQSHSLRLTWNQSSAANFSHYAIFRASSSGVDFNSEPVAEVYGRTNLTCLATALALDTDYYFRVYAVNAYGIYSPNGTAAYAHTLNHPIPFADDFEESLEGWNLTGSWGADSSMAHGGSFSLGDSPAHAYTSSVDSYAQTAVNLSGSDWPVLKFWDRYQLGASDNGRVEVSPDGSSWTRLYAVREGGRTEWAQHTIDLSEWKNAANLRIRFYFYSDSNAGTTGDGWNIDDLEVTDYTPAAPIYPLQEDFEAGADGWLKSTWVMETNAPHAGTGALADKQDRRVVDYLQLCSVLGRKLDLTAAVAPQMVYWLKGSSDNSRSIFQWQVSKDNGLSWEDVAGTYTTAAYANWTRFQVALTAYVGQSVRLRARSYAGQYGYELQYMIDDITIEDQTANTVLYPLVPHLKSMDLSWQPSAVSNFKRYEIYRDTNPTVTITDTLVGSFTDVNVTNLTDSGLSIGQTYYYRLFVVNSNETYSSGYEQFAATVPLPFGLSDPMENLDSWVATGSWGVDTTTSHGGSTSIADSPGNAYAVSQDSYILTSMSLQGSSWPALKFWDRYQLGAADNGRVEVSPDGSSWTRLYAVREGGRTEWTQHTIDLSEWKNAANLRIRFYFYSDSNAGTTGDGWNIDDLEIADHSPAAPVYPLQEDFEAGADEWLKSTWLMETNSPRTGLGALVDKPDRRVVDYLQMCSVLGRKLDLTAAVAPQMVYWLKGSSDNSRSIFQWQVSKDNGLSWEDVAGTYTTAAYADWTRFQVSLAAYVGQSVRLRARSYAGQYGYELQYRLDDITIEDQTVNTVLYPLVPHLKSMDLSWQPSAVSNFKRYEIYRDTNPTVTIADTLVGSFTDVNITNLTDSGLSIGQTYYYRLFVVNSNETYSSGYEQFNNTVPLPFGLTEPMENLDNWVSTGSWGVDATTSHGGSASVGDSPGNPYAVSQDSYILTSMDLSGTAWPVLTFWDRYQLGATDNGRVEVSTDGSGWTRLYAVREGTRTEWKQHTIDLSEWKSASNLRIRFYFYSDSNAGTIGDGWNIDDLEITDHTPAAPVYPLYEGFEAGADEWLRSTWTMETNTPYAGSGDLVDKPDRRVVDYLQLCSVLGRKLDLTTAVAPQLVYWLKGSSDNYRSSFQWQISTNDGLGWSDIAGTSTTAAYADWTHFQVSLAAYVGQSVRLRARSYAGQYGYELQYRLDNIAIEDQTANTVLYPLVPHLKNMDLSWQPSAVANFKRYEIYRDVNPTVTVSDTLVGSFTDINATNLTDSGLSIGQTYYYRLFVVNSNETYSSGYEQFANTVPITLGLTDPMETMANWVATGSWGVDTTVKHTGSASVGDSPGSAYAVSQDSYLLTALNLSGSGWPVLKFWDRYQLGAADNGRVEVSTDGSSWTRLYVVREGSRTAWAQHTIDLSEWKNSTNLRIRFYFYSDGNAGTTADGWNLDDVEVVDHIPASPVYPLYDDFEAGAGSWLTSTWMLETNTPYAGARALVDKQDRRVVDYLQMCSVLGRKLDLTTAVAPQMVYWLKGSSDNYRSSFQWQISTNDGLSWSDIAGTSTTAAYADWTRFQVSLAAYIGQSVRLRARSYAGQYGYELQYMIDNVGISEPEPGAPQPLSPLAGELVPQLRPTLTVRNALDGQGDQLTYEFEVFDDETLSNRVANVPALASGVSNTSWQVDLELIDKQQYWWRCRAHDGTEYGAWSATESFTVNHLNLPPGTVTIVGPPRASILHNLSYELSWLPAVDPDLNDAISTYHLQIADNAAFLNPVVDDSSVAAADGSVLLMPLSSFAGSGGLQNGTVYYWRLRAADLFGAWSGWTTGNWYFEFGTLPFSVDGFIVNGMLHMQWNASGARVQLQHSPSLTAPDWQPVGEPTWDTQITIPLPPESTGGFYRLIVIE